MTKNITKHEAELLLNHKDTTQHRVTIALPSKGALADPTLDFLKACDLSVVQTNPRQYLATVPNLPNLDVLFQRVTDIVYKVVDGTVDLGISGLDVAQELAGENENVIVLHDNLRYGGCQLLLAVPEAWIDVETMMDIADIALDFREQKHRSLRVATKFTNLTRQFLHQHGVHHFTIVEAEGAIEAAPTLGYADIIVDLSATGTTLRENHLKPLGDGILLESNACLIGNLRRLRERPEVLDTARMLLEMIDGSLHGRKYYQLTANIRGATADSVAHAVASNPVTGGLQGPTVAPIYAANTPEKDDGQWYSATIIVPSKQLMAAVTHLRSIGGTHTTVIPVRYVFMPQSPSYQRLMEQLAL
ncbi:MAG: ATP phosphoribosyltransferase [Chloroflexota bacterium]